MGLITASDITISCSEQIANGQIETVYLADAADIDDASVTTSGHAISAWSFTGVDQFYQVVHRRGAASLTFSDSSPAEGGRAVTGNLSIVLQGTTSADLVSIEEIRKACKVVAVVKFFDQTMSVLGWDLVANSEVAMLPGDAEGGSSEEFGGARTVSLNFAIAQHELPLEYTGTEAALTS